MEKMSSVLSEFCENNKESFNFDVEFMKDVPQQKESKLHSDNNYTNCTFNFNHKAELKLPKKFCFIKIC